MEKSKALWLADELDAYHTRSCHKEAAAELRRLHEENETLKQSVARLQQHHATAWNRGHTMGMKANEDTARRALDAVKQDAWGNTQLTEALLKVEEQRDALLKALKTYGWHTEDCPQYPTHARPKNWPDCTCGFDAAIALAEGRVAAVEGEKT